MENFQFEETQWSHLSDHEFIGLLRVLPRPSTQFTRIELLVEFNNRQWDYSCIVDNAELSTNATPKFHLDSQLLIKNNVIFEKRIQKPTQVGNFYRNYLHPAIISLQNNPLLQGLELVTFDYIREQMYMTDSTLSVITPEQLPELKPNQVFVYMQLNGKTFPTSSELEPFIKNKTKVIYHRQEGFRMFGEFEVI